MSDGGNTDLETPAITTVSATTLQGIACTGCRVEILSDFAAEGVVYEDFSTADGAGNWAFTKLVG